MSIDGRCPICNHAEDTAGRCYNPTCLGQAPTTFTPGPPVHVPYVHVCCGHVTELRTRIEQEILIWKRRLNDERARYDRVVEKMKEKGDRWGKRSFKRRRARRGIRYCSYMIYALEGLIGTKKQEL